MEVKSITIGKVVLEGDVLKPNHSYGKDAYVTISYRGNTVELVGDIYPILCLSGRGREMLTELSKTIFEFADAVISYCQMILNGMGCEISRDWRDWSHIYDNIFKDVSSAINDIVINHVNNTTVMISEALNIISDKTREISVLANAISDGRFAIYLDNRLLVDINGISLMLTFKSMDGCGIEHTARDLGVKRPIKSQLIDSVRSAIAMTSQIPVIDIKLSSSSRRSLNLILRYSRVIKEVIERADLTNNRFYKLGFIYTTGAFPLVTVKNGVEKLSKIMSIIDYISPHRDDFVTRREFIRDMVDLDMDDLDLMHKLFSGWVELDDKILLVDDFYSTSCSLILAKFDDSLKMRMYQFNYHGPRNFIESVKEYTRNLLNGGGKKIHFHDLSKDARRLLTKKYPELALIY